MTETPTLPAPERSPDGSSEQPATPANPYLVTQQPVAPPASNGFSVSSLALGIVSIPTGIWVVAIVAIVLGFVARGREPHSRALANWGIALGFVGLFGWVLFAVLGFVIALPFLTLVPFWW